MANAAVVVAEGWRDGLRPEPRLTVSEWADTYRSLPQKSSAEPGRWRTARTPYLREIMDSLSATSGVEEVVFMKAAQVGGTEAILNVLGYAIAHAPGPILAVQPTVELAKRYSRQRIDPLVRFTPKLRDLVSEQRSRDSANTMLSKDFVGGMLVITGANSAVGLRSMPVRWLLLDEIDGYPDDVDGEGSPIELAEARQRTFARRKRIKVSTPTIDGYSEIQDAWNASDQRRYHVPCPECGEMQPLEFPRLVWTRLDRAPSQAAYECRACACVIEHHEKTAMLAWGEWRPDAPEKVGRVRGYHLSALYSPAGWLSWGDIATQFVADHKDQQKHRVFVNTVLGETWKQRGEVVDWELLMRRRETYPIRTAPRGVLFITAGVDVQKDRVIYEVVGWGRGKESWSIDAGVITGDTSDPRSDAWSGLDALLGYTYPHESGVDMAIRVLAIDSGAFTQSVYAWARRHPITRVIAIKGQQAGQSLLLPPSIIEINHRGQRLKGGYKVWNVCGPIAKEELNGWLRLQLDAETRKAPPGYCHFPEYGPEFFKELTSEHLVRQVVKGRPRLVWEPIAGRANHGLDCRVYARAAACHGKWNMDRFTDSDWRTLERAIGDTPTLASSTAASPAESPEGASRATPLQPARAPWLAPKKGWLR